MEAALSNLSLPQPLTRVSDGTHRLPSFHLLCFLLILAWSISTRTPGSFSDKTLSLALSFLGSPGFEGKGGGWFGHAVSFSWRRLWLPLEDAGESETQGQLHRCQLYCSKNILPFIALIFHSLLPEWRHMLGFCICNWGRTDGRDAVGSNTVIKIIYTARNFRACTRRWVEPRAPSSSDPFLMEIMGGSRLAEIWTFLLSWYTSVGVSLAPKAKEGTDGWKCFFR